MSERQEYWGIYCEDTGLFLVDDRGYTIYYPSQGIATALMKKMKRDKNEDRRLVVKKFD